MRCTGLALRSTRYLTATWSAEEHLCLSLANRTLLPLLGRLGSLFEARGASTGGWYASCSSYVWRGLHYLLRGFSLNIV